MDDDEYPDSAGTQRAYILIAHRPFGWLTLSRRVVYCSEPVIA